MFERDALNDALDQEAETVARHFHQEHRRVLVVAIVVDWAQSGADGSPRIALGSSRSPEADDCDMLNLAIGLNTALGELLAK